MIKELEPLANFVLNKKEEESDEEVVVYQRLLPQGKSKITNLDVKEARRIWNSDELFLKINDNEDKDTTPFSKITIIGSKLVNRNFEHQIGYIDIKETTLVNCKFFNTLYNCSLTLSVYNSCSFERNNSIINCYLNSVTFYDCNFYNEFRNSIIKDCTFKECRFFDSKIDRFNCDINACGFENCKFINCTFKLPPVSSTFDNCSFDNCSGSLESNIKLV